MKPTFNQAAVWRFGSYQTVRIGVLAFATLMLTVLLYWEYGVENSYSFSRPSLIWEVFTTQYQMLLAYTSTTAAFVGFGIVVGSLIGVASGLLLAVWNRWWLTGSLAVALFIVFPKTAVFLVLVGRFGVLTDTSLYLMPLYTVAIFMAFMTFRSTRAVITDAGNSWLELAIMLYPSRWLVTRHCILPQILPSLFTYAAYTTLSLWPFMIFAEPIGAPGVPGLGNFVYNAFVSGWWDHFFAGSLVLTVAGLTSVALIMTLGRLMTKA